MAFSSLLIRRQVICRMENHCRQELPWEGCGILAGHGREITRFFPIPNQDASPQSFSFAPRVYLETLKEMRQLSLDFLGILHSHPCSDPWPSAKDIREWHYPELTSWILSLKNDKPRLAAYRIQNGQVLPLKYRVTGRTSDPS